MGVCFEIVEWGIDAAGENLTAGLAFEALTPTLGAVADQSMNRFVGDATVGAIAVRTSETLGVHGFLAATSTFLLGIGRDSLAWDDRQFNPLATMGTVMRRFGMPLNGLVIFPVFRPFSDEPFKLCSQQEKDNHSQQHVDDE